MAVEQGTASNFVDFYNKLRDFLTSNADLVSASQEWTQIAGNTGALTLDDTITVQGPGLAGDDEIRVRLRPVYAAVENRYNLELVGVPNWNPALDQLTQFNMSDPVYIHLWNSSMPYTFVANARCFKAVAQVTSVVEACYGGFILPYALPAEYPYPLAVGGSSNVSTWLYSQVDVRHSHFVNPSNALKLYLPGNTWLSMANFTQVSGNLYSWSPNSANVLPYSGASSSAAPFRNQWAMLRECFGGEFPLHPLILVSNVPTIARLGVLDGCYWVPGLANSHGNTLDVSAPGDHIAIQNVARTDNHLGYWALKLE